jgi:hypothetical protein
MKAIYVLEDAVLVCYRAAAVVEGCRCSLQGTEVEQALATCSCVKE